MRHGTSTSCAWSSRRGRKAASRKPTAFSTSSRDRPRSRSPAKPRVNAGEGLFIGAGKSAELKASGSAPSTFLHFFLVSAADVDKPAETAPAVVKGVYRTTAPIPDLRPGGYDLNLTRVTFPAGMPSNAPHHRSGAALYHVLSGTGADTIDGKVITRAPGSFIYEPFDLVHQWGNPGSEPLTFITFNINPEGVAAVLQGAPAKTR
jgi:quercetin dioxygenase-like cupin family protein